MTQRDQIYQCKVCGDVVEVQHDGGGTLGCCDRPMDLLGENTTDAAKEKHVPVIERSSGMIRVTIGSVPHPMEEKHYIEWIQLVADGRAYREYLKPGMAPEAIFRVEATDLTAREHCNLHGVWKARG
jgi:superoxide reductase